MDSIIFDVQSLYDVALSQLHDHIHHIFSKARVDQDAIHSVAAEITNGPHAHIFDGLKTQSQQIDYYKKHFQFMASAYTRTCMYFITRHAHPSCLTQMPIKVVLGTRRKAKGLGAKRRFVEVEESFMYVLILETLQTLLNNDTVLTEVCQKF